VRSKYITSLSEGQYIPCLFATIISELDLDTDRPVDLDKLSYEHFELEDVEDEKKKIQANTAFIFAQALEYASALLRCVSHNLGLITRTEWLGMRDRVVQDRVQGYVAKHMSSKLILKELSTIKTATSSPQFNEENLEVSVNEVTKEIVTRYQVDEGQKTEMVIRLPASYPLAEVEIVGTNRVGVREERWNKWLLTCKISCKVLVMFFRSLMGRLGRS
jgi:hypothetical protein